MSNTNTNLQTQTSNALYNAIMEAGGKDHPPMLAPGNYVQWKSRIKTYNDTKLNNELIYYCLQNPPYKFKWNEKAVLIAEGSSETTIEGYMESYKIVSQDIRNQLDVEAEVMWKAIERLKLGESINVQDLDTNLYWEFKKFTSRDGESLESYYSRFYKMVNELVRNKYDVTNHQVNVQFLLKLQPEWQRSQQAATRHKGKAIINSSPPIYDQEPDMVTEDDALSKDKEIDKLMALISLSFKKIYKPTNNNLINSSNTSRQVVQQSAIQCYNCKEYKHVAKECQKPKRTKDAAYHKDDTDYEPEDQELEAHYLYMAHIQEVTPDAADNSGPIFDAEPLQKVQSDNNNYNVFANDNEHPEQSKSINDTYPDEQGDTNIPTDSLDMSNNGGHANQDEDDDLVRERDLLASLIDKLKCKIDENKNHNKLLELSNKTLVDKLKGEIEDFKKRKKSLESSNNHFKKANNEL
ncbi:integrase, catalytic region, zinc finger, CCHC-type containing protein [Tanacetum coccineum]